VKARHAAQPDDVANSESFREQAGPITKWVARVCHDTLPWLISFSLDANARRCRHVIAVRGHRC